MKNKFLNLTLLFSLTTALFIACNSNNTNNNSSDSSMNHNDETSLGMGAVQTDSIDNDTIHTHRGMQEDNTEVKK